MRLLVISYFHGQPDSIGSLRTRAMERLLPEHDIEVSVLTSGDHKEDFRIYKNTISIKSNTYFEGGVLTNTVRKVKSKLLRLATANSHPTSWETTTLANLPVILGAADPEVILCTYPPVYALRLGLKISALTKLPIVTDFRDSFLIDAIEPGLKYKWTRKYGHYEKLNSEVLERSALITAASTAISDSFRTSCERQNAQVIYNGFESRTKLDVFKDFNGSGINVVHTGRVSLSERGTSIKGLVIALKKLTARDADLSAKIRFHFVGELSLCERASLNSLASAGVVKIWGPVAREKALSMQLAADILLLITKPRAKNALSGKLIEYLRLAKPILALTSGSEAEVILKRTELGIITQPDDPDAIAEAILKISCRDDWSVINGNDAEIAKFRDTYVMKTFANELQKIQLRCSDG